MDLALNAISDSRLYRSNAPFASLPTIGKRPAKSRFEPRSWKVIEYGKNLDCGDRYRWRKCRHFDTRLTDVDPFRHLNPAALWLHYIQLRRLLEVCVGTMRLKNKTALITGGNSGIGLIRNRLFQIKSTFRT